MKKSLTSSIETASAGKTITVKNSDIPGCEELRLSTDDIITCESAKEIAKAVDPEGYEKEVKARKEACR